MKPDGDLVSRFRDNGGGDKPLPGRLQGLLAPRPRTRARRIAYRLWPNAGVPGELSQVLPSRRHFEQAAQLVTPEQVRQGFVCGNSADAHLEMIDRYAKAGFDEVYVGNAGPHWEGLFDLYQREVLPHLR